MENLTITKVAWPRLKVFWFSEDYPTGLNGDKKRNSQQKQGVGGGGGSNIIKGCSRWTLSAQVGQLKTGQGGMGLLRVICGAPIFG